MYIQLTLKKCILAGVTVDGWSRAVVAIHGGYIREADEELRHAFVTIGSRIWGFAWIAKK